MNSADTDLPPPVKENEKKEIEDKPVSVEELLESVPRPLIPHRPDLVQMYKRCWILGLIKSKRAVPGSGFIDWYIDDAFDNRYFQWDICFSIAWAKYSQGTLPNIACLDNFYGSQHKNGAIPGVLQQETGKGVRKPTSPYFSRNNLFSWIEYEYYRTTGDRSRFERVVPVLKDYAEWIRNHRRHDNGHFYWSGYSSGMDNSPRSRPETFYPPYSWIDHDANEALAARYLSRMAELINDTTTATESKEFHSEMKRLINRDMWSEKDQFYWDLDRDGSFLKHKTIASFWPLWADVCESEQADGLVSHLEDERSFNRPHRIPTLSADHEEYADDGNYWRGSVWPPTNHMVLKGLETSDRNKLAREVVVNHLNNVSEVYRSSNTVWENYAPEFASPGTPSKKDFTGWSALGPIAQLIEHYIGIRKNVPEQKITWHLFTTRKIGIENLKFGQKYVSLVAASRDRASSPVKIDVNVEKELTLEVNTETDRYTTTLKPESEEVQLSGDRTNPHGCD